MHNELRQEYNKLMESEKKFHATSFLGMLHFGWTLFLQGGTRNRYKQLKFQKKFKCHNFLWITTPVFYAFIICYKKDRYTLGTTYSFFSGAFYYVVATVSNNLLAKFKHLNVNSYKHNLKQLVFTNYK